MAKVLTCREVGMDCDFVAPGNSEEEILAPAAVQAQKDHGFTSIPPEAIEKVRAALHGESPRRCSPRGETRGEH